MWRATLWAILLVMIHLYSTALSQDTLYVYGGPGTLEGKFETAGGLPDRQSWIGVDLTQDTDSYWHIDTYRCANLDPGQVNNHAWWCGEKIPSCGPPDPDGGYGNNYRELLDYYAEILDDQVSTNITVSAILNYDNEPGYDYLYLKQGTAAGMQVIETFNWIGDSIQVVSSITFHSADYVPHPDSGNPSCQLRWLGSSDGAWSDEDCTWPTAGLAQIDLIQVSGDNGVVTTLEDCEGPTALWRVGFDPGVGDFSKVWPLLDDADPYEQNDTPQFAFIDDGIVVPGTGGTQCITWCYGPGGYCANGSGGLLGPEFSLRNEIWSPPVALSEDVIEIATLMYDVYRHDPCSLCPTIVDAWRIRTTTDPGGVSDWTEWSEAEITGQVCTPRYIHREWDITEGLPPGDSFLQVALGAYDVCWWWPNDPTPAPYFDNVAVYTVSGLSDLPERERTLWLAEPVPNPFNPSTTIEIHLPRDCQVILAVYDLRGQLVRSLLDEPKPAGTHGVRWDGRGDNGAGVAAGSYIFRLDAGGKSITRKGVLLK